MRFWHSIATLSSKAILDLISSTLSAKLTPSKSKEEPAMVCTVSRIISFFLSSTAAASGLLPWILSAWIESDASLLEEEEVDGEEGEVDEEAECEEETPDGNSIRMREEL